MASSQPSKLVRINTFLFRLNFLSRDEDKVKPTKMPRDRLAAMQAKAGGDDDDFAVPVDDEMEGAMKDFFKEIEEIRTNCDKIDGKIKDVKKLQSEILSSPNVDQKMQSQMDDYMADIKKVANSVRTK